MPTDDVSQETREFAPEAVRANSNLLVSALSLGVSILEDASPALHAKLDTLAGSGEGLALHSLETNPLLGVFVNGLISAGENFAKEHGVDVSAIAGLFEALTPIIAKTTSTNVTLPLPAGKTAHGW